MNQDQAGGTNPTKPVGNLVLGILNRGKNRPSSRELLFPRDIETGGSAATIFFEMNFKLI